MKFSNKVALWSFNILFYCLLFFSVLGVISIHITLSKDYSFCLTPKGLNNYLDLYKNLSTLFITSITVIIAKFTLMQWHASIEATKDKMKEDRFKEWCYVLERVVKHVEIAGTDVDLVENFLNLRRKLFNLLYDKNMIIIDVEELYMALNIFENCVIVFEEGNSEYKKQQGIYYKSDFAYSARSFELLFLCCTELSYSKIIPDLNVWYINHLNKNRTVRSI